MAKPIRLLIIEDVEDDALLVMREIRKGGVELISKRVDSKEDLVQALEQKTWDMAISDYSMPGFTGIDALKIVKKNDPDLPFILISGAIGEEIAVKALKEGAEDYLMKDNLTRLPSAIKRELEDVKVRKARKKAVKDLENSEKKYRLLVENLNDVIYHTDLNGIINYVSPVIKSVAGYDQSELVGQLFTNIIHKDDLKYFIDLFQKPHNSYEKTSEYRLIQKSGKAIWVRSSSKLIYEGENAIGAQGVLTDISEEKLLQAQLQQAQKMESIGQLAGGIAHDFNNILYPIMGFAELSIDELPKNHPVRENLEVILQGTIRARDLVKQILSFSSQRKEIQKPLLLKPLIEETLKLLRATIPTNIEINYKLYDKPDYVLANPIEIHEIVMNLCTNAYHAMEETGGFLNIHLDRSIPAANLNLPSDEYCCLSVNDTGCGISPEVIDNIFDPYFTTKRLGKGSGLGLSVVHGIITNYEGAITVESTPNNGTIFNLYFPLTQEEEIPEEKFLPPSDIGGDEKILFVDDEETIVKLGVRLLERSGYKVTGETNSIEAFNTFKSNPTAFDLVITDMAMPKMVGTQLAKKILEISPKIPILICTGYSQRVDDNIAKKIGIKAYINKPILPKELFLKVRKALDQSKK